MINRIGKLSALIAALSIVSVIIPLNYAEASTRLETKDGTFTKAVAFGNGTYVYNGYKNEDDSNLYISDGENNTVVENIEDYDYNTLFKYSKSGVTLEDGEDNYVLELMSGKIIEDSYETLIHDNLANKLKSALKKTDRYGSINKPFLSEINNNVFGEKWYLYTLAPEENADGHGDIIDNVLYQTIAGSENIQSVLMGFVSEQGKYIDASSTANLCAVSSLSGKMVKVKEFNKESDNGSVTAKINPYMRVIGQDSGYIYTLINADLTGAVNDHGYYIQKISKEPGEVKDGAYLPKSVTSYEISSAYNDCDDAKDAFNLLFLGDNDYRATAESTNITVKNDDIYVAQIKNDNSKVKITKLKLKKDKVKIDIEGEEKTVDQYLLEKDSDKEHDIVNGTGSLTIDADSNFWILDKGKIYKFDGEDFKEMYVCDRSMDNIDVYNDNNLVAWDSDGDVYAAIQNGMNKQNAPVNTEENADGKTENSGADAVTENKAEGENTAQVENSSEDVNEGWIQNTDGSWSYGKDKAAVKSEWIKDADKWYYLNENGIMVTGWNKINENWYYMNNSGDMATGWIQDNGSWYYLKASGDMATGWTQVNGKWYYLNFSGTMVSNTVVNGYILGKDGAWVK